MADPDDLQAPVAVQLASEAKQCREMIADIVSNAQSVLNAGWGQYVGTTMPDEPEHTGIFGTAAAIEILAGANAAEYRERICRGVATLPHYVDAVPAEQILQASRDAGAHYVGKGDLTVTHKVAALLDVGTILASSPRCGLNVDLEAAAQRLLDLRTGGSGWPDYEGGGNSSKHATAVALLSLSRLNNVRVPNVGDALRDAQPLFEHVNFDNLAISTTSILLVALQNFAKVTPHFVNDLEAWTKVRSRAEASVGAWISSTSPGAVRRSLEATEYASPPRAQAEQAPANGVWSFLLYLPHVMASEAVLGSERLRRSAGTRRFVLRVVQILVSRIQAERKFVTGGRSQVSTVEQLWICRLLHTFEASVEAHGLYGKNLVRMATDRVALSTLPGTIRLLIPIIVIVLLVATGIVVGGVTRSILLTTSGIIAGRYIGAVTRSVSRW